MTDIIKTHDEQTTCSTLYGQSPQVSLDEVRFEVRDTGIGIMLSQADNKIASLEKDIIRLRQENARLRHVEAMLVAQTKALADELLSYINKTNNDLKSSISYQDLDPPEYHDAQTVYEAFKLLQDIKEQSL